LVSANPIPARARRSLIYALAVGAALFHLYAAGISPFTALVQRPVHLALMAFLGFAGIGVQTWRSRGEGVESEDETARGWRVVNSVVAGVFIGGALLSCAYLVFQHETLVRRAGAATGADLLAGAVAIVVVLELARRATGWGLVSVALLAIGYAITGPYLPGFLAHRGYGLTRLVEHLYLSTEGIWGVPLGVSADFVYLFVLFGAVLETAGGSGLLVALAARIAGRSRGGPAKTAAMASGLMGSLSGSAVANVVTTGALTIPLMKRTGFRPHFAGAIEAAASTGGQLMPPIMGAGAFILATWTNIPYLHVAAAALIPAVLYYVALFAAIHFQAGRMQLAQGTEATEPVLPRLHLLVPLAVIVALLAAGRSPMRAAFWGVVAALAATVLGGATRIGWSRALDALVAAGRGTVQVAAACAAAGIVVGVASLTGIGLRMSEFIITFSGGHLPIALLLTAIGSIIIGMGLPTTAAYVVLAALGAPALTELGVPLLAAHLFIFFFGCMSNVTPPVSLAAYAAAGLAGAPPMVTALTAMTLAAAGFVVPFVFVYVPELLLLDATVVGVLTAAFTSAVGVTALAGVAIGFTRRRLAVWERMLLAVAALGLFVPGIVTDAIGLIWFALAFWGRPSWLGGPRASSSRSEA
jgi:TRAP transporter 4TM/12TM fusion protein